ncbi:MAG: prenyltransferase [Burkholderiales bacterium]|nr:MAG: prenyltransferase [Burkholderiales bacterium]
MTRPGSLLLTLVACVLGTATAAACGCGLDPGLALGATVLALWAHAAANVLNDWQDAVSGADAANTQAVTPFTGGSRLIQQGQVSVARTRELALGMLLVLLPGGLWLVAQTGGGIFWLGMAGVLLAWAYSAPPLRLMTRGLGELAVGLAWALMVIGMDYVQRRHFFPIPASVALNFGLLVAALLLANSIPDARSDALVGKRTLAVRLGPRGSAGMYAALVLLGHGWLVLAVALLIPPVQALWGLLSLPLSLLAAAWLWRHGSQPERLRPALLLSVLAVLVHALGMSWGFAQLARNW